MRRRDCVRNLDTPFSVRQETSADDSEMRVLECRAIMQRSAGTRLDITRGLVDVKLWKQIICNPRFEREIKLVRL